MIVTLAFSGQTQEDFVDDDRVEAGSYSFRYGAIFASASSEIAGTTLVVFMIDRFGRIPSQVFSYLFGGIFTFIFCLVVSKGEAPHGVLIFLSFFARMFFMGGSCSTWVSTAEILSTDIRTTGHAAANAIARLGGSLSPFLVRDSVDFTTIGTAMLVVSLVTAFSSYHLPETRGFKMGEVLSISPSTDTSKESKQEGETSSTEYQIL